VRPDWLADYLPWSRTKAHAARVERARGIVGRALGQAANPYVACSFGKDSIVLLDLVQDVQPDIPVMYHDSGVELPESVQVRAWLEERGRLPHLVVSRPPRPVLEALAADHREAVFGRDDHAAYDREALVAPIDATVREQGFDLVFLGLRKQESLRRRKLLGHRGPLFYAESRGVWECCPLADWRAEDVFAYLAIREALPVHPAYSMTLLAEDRGRIRVNWWCSVAMANRGRLVWLKYYYPSLFNRFAAEFPEVRAYV